MAVIQVKEIARLYPSQCGYTLVVGLMQHQLDVERTAAVSYTHLAHHEGELIMGKTMRDLRINLESNTTTPVDTKAKEVIQSILYQRQQDNISKTTSYVLDDSFNQISTIDYI